MEFYIKNMEDPGFDASFMQSDEEIGMLLTQIETCIFTKKGDVLGDPAFGANLEDYVYSFMFNDSMLKNVITEQFNRYIPLARKYNTQVEVEFLGQNERNVVFVDITIDNTYKVEIYI
jgi:hypothetical protein|tara:strand:- start:5240 stop:5593 length:354 start_codon:yes stop_codon:yes gene_type:complete